MICIADSLPIQIEEIPSTIFNEAAEVLLLLDLVERGNSGDSDDNENETR